MRQGLELPPMGNNERPNSKLEQKIANNSERPYIGPSQN